MRRIVGGYTHSSQFGKCRLSGFLRIYICGGRQHRNSVVNSKTTDDFTGFFVYLNAMSSTPPTIYQLSPLMPPQTAIAGGHFNAHNPAIEIHRPTTQTVPLVFASPHSGRVYPDSLIAQSSLAIERLRSSEDAFVDQLFDWVPQFGASQLLAHFPRVWVDVNRNATEIDADMFSDNAKLADPRPSSRVAAGLGVIPKLVGEGESILPRQLTWAEGQQRLTECYLPYHRALTELIAETRARFDMAVIIDCHSMPSSAAGRSGSGGPDIVLGDGFGDCAAPWLIEQADAAFTAEGLTVRRNYPYAGGFTTRHYGRPRIGQHALQIEINRRLYMDEMRITPTAGLDPLRQKLAAAMQRLVNTLSLLLQADRAAE